MLLLVWLPVPLLLAAIVVLRIAGPPGSFEHPYLLLLLSPVWVCSERSHLCA